MSLLTPQNDRVFAEKEVGLSCNTEKDKVKKLHHTAGI